MSDRMALGKTRSCGEEVAVQRRCCLDGRGLVSVDGIVEDIVGVVRGLCG